MPATARGARLPDPRAERQREWHRRPGSNDIARFAFDDGKPQRLAEDGETRRQKRAVDWFGAPHPGDIG